MIARKLRETFDETTLITSAQRGNSNTVLPTSIRQQMLLLSTRQTYSITQQGFCRRTKPTPQFTPIWMDEQLRRPRNSRYLATLQFAEKLSLSCNVESSLESTAALAGGLRAYLDSVRALLLKVARPARSSDDVSREQLQEPKGGQVDDGEIIREVL